MLKRIRIRCRITPAYAGNTKTRFLSMQKNRDHPRLRGEHLARCSHVSSTLGSPPPTRGTQVVVIPCSFRPGITPAYAGNTVVSVLRPLQDREHPRLRGEHLQLFDCSYLYSGSPPPTRGTRFVSSVFYLLSRITPAYAGNTPACLSKKVLVWDHPRLRGEHLKLELKA